MEIQAETGGLGQREAEQAVFATFLHSQPVGQKASLRDLTVLLSSTRPDKIQLEKALKRWIETSWFLDEAAINEVTVGPDGKTSLPKSWRLGSKPNLTQMHHDARTRVSTDLIEAKLLKTIEGLKSLTSGTSGDGYKPLPWATVRPAIDGACQGRYLERTEDSGPWPCDYPGARHVRLQAREPKPVIDTAEQKDKQPKPPAGVVVASGYLKPGEIQDLADQIGELGSAAVGYDMKVLVRIELGSDGNRPPEDVVARLNAKLAGVSKDLALC